MKRHSLTIGLALFVLAGGAFTPLRAGVDFRFPVGISFSTGALRVVDELDDLNNFDTSFAVPVGLSLHPYVEFDFGLGIGASIGPTSLLFIEERYYGWTYYEQTSFNWLVPIGLDARYTFMREKAVSPYVRAGFRYPVLGGDFFEGGRIGPFGAVGVELWRSRRVGLGIEAAYDGSEMDVTGRLAPYKARVKPNEFLFSVYAVF
jgi:hypothetical protein